LAGFVVFLTLAAIPVDAGIRPSFSLDRCTWSATHIVSVQTTPTDGVFSVVESWKGDLKAGDSLEIPELKPNKDCDYYVFMTAVVDIGLVTKKCLCFTNLQT
jgi:hypothetical protein